MIAYDRLGTRGAAALVLIHGLGGDRHVWAPVVQRLAGEYDIVALDLPGFGGSAALSDVPSPPRLAAAVATFLREELGWERPHLAGNSLGGWVALELARAAAAASVTAIAPAGFWARPLGPKPTALRDVARLARPLLPVLMRSARVRRLGLAGSVAHPERVPLAAAIAMASAYAGAPGFAAVNAAMRASQFSHGEQIDVPVTIAWCERDRLVGPPRQPLLQAREVVLRDCGHVPMYDDPDAVAGVVRQGARQVGPVLP